MQREPLQVRQRMASGVKHDDFVVTWRERRCADGVDGDAIADHLL
ncbi:MAG TPA: hypothetical protein VNN80_14355 [Polyangiaceae bacterium]|jgi:hypothetical protein|nr:hypothetical protein [Polyangiaceae bacterium]